MNRFTWLVLLAGCLLVSTSFATPSRAVDRLDAAAPVRQDPGRLLPARYAGVTVITTAEPLTLRVVGDVENADIGTAPSGFVWRLEDRVVSRSAELVFPLTIPGRYLVYLSHGDVHGNRYEAQIPVRVMEPEAYSAMKAAALAAAQLPLWLEEDEVFLPFVAKSESPN